MCVTRRELVKARSPSSYPLWGASRRTRRSVLKFRHESSCPYSRSVILTNQNISSNISLLWSRPPAHPDLPRSRHATSSCIPFQVYRLNTTGRSPPAALEPSAFVFYGIERSVFNSPRHLFLLSFSNKRMPFSIPPSPIHNHQSTLVQPLFLWHNLPKLDVKAMMGTSRPRTAGSEPGNSASRVSGKGRKSSRSRDLKSVRLVGLRVGKPEANRYPGRVSPPGCARERPQGKQSGTA